MLPTPSPTSPSELIGIKRVQFKGKSILLKKSNTPYLVHQKYQIMKESNLKKRQEEQINSNSNSTIYPFISFTLKYSILIGLLSLGLSKMIMEHWFWGYDGKWVQLDHYWPKDQKTFTLEELSKYDGIQDPKKPILLSINGNVYNMNSNRAMYGPGGTYHHFIGRDASRAFVTGCFKSGLTFDLRGFNDQQKKALNHWIQFFENSPKYPKVGKVILPKLDSNLPLPKDCDPKLEGGAV
ncbi:cytochrome b5-like heme/steroid binding domain-containing protein [Melampsora americana]|nr:cytochrome b5-like heme/steroid binding domain-containing protein [Melampsora americana]